MIGVQLGGMGKEQSPAAMFKYLKKRKCPRCYYDFVVVLIDCSGWMRRINGFCGRCDHYVDWQLFRSEVVQRSKDAAMNALSRNELHRPAPRLMITRKAAVNLKHNS
jgi:hypothetical protein